MPRSFQLSRRADFSHACELPAELSSMLVEGQLDDIRACGIRSGRKTLSLDQIFEISSGSDEAESVQVTFHGDLSNIHGLGRNWQRGELHLAGSAGDCVGEAMTGGAIRVTGNVADALGRGMSGGRILVEGNAGDYLGAELPGETRGMTGGEICVQGNAGRYCGSRMRRGTVVIGGGAGEHLADLMLAGTIVCCGDVTGPVGIGMKRGTLLLLKEPVAETLVAFDQAVTYQPVFTRVLFRHLRAIGFLPNPAEIDPASFVRYLGDATAGQRAEILVAS
ncbi:formylmethanofuran dehydrogenase subunit C [Rubinisphaera margarita]|uniref:formylmethanofuran dehydrogenase subunit C n=1 Tax=Rubinisphaera margarita TaxID=2909586 RepID=UPI001EE87D0F|nr:formylmethanofuran dehydrogenase subunit C [Rubinisphaera margarita]MCG6156273.1 formylmethanofuran dehydrogenase subunit C [Rubinisphaera margarita]